jgi:hypothetical protein
MSPFRLFACAAALVTLAVSAVAQAPQVVRLRGAIEAMDGNTVTIKTREGTSQKVTLNDNWVVALVAPVTMADIKPNTFVGIASLKGPDGALYALEVLVFPEAMRGAGEGHYPWDLQPESLMTNATVDGVVAGSDATSVTLKYKDGTQTIKVRPNTPIVTFLPGTKEDAKVGAKVFVGTQKQADGSLRAGRLNVGKDGMMPPM